MNIARMEQVVNDLNGTCQSLLEVLNADENPDDRTLAHFIDQHIFECAGCGWWCEMDEAHSDGAGGFFCDDCAADQQDD